VSSASADSVEAHTTTPTAVGFDIKTTGIGEHDIVTVACMEPDCTGHVLLRRRLHPGSRDAGQCHAHTHVQRHRV
jgi:hypothetical protein